MLIESEILVPGIVLIRSNPDVRGILNSDGSINVFFKGKEKNFQFLSGAARYLEGKSLNGWRYWQTHTSEGLRALRDYRDQYILLKKES